MEALLLSVTEVATLLHVHHTSVRRSIRAGLIPSKSLRGSIRISRAWVDAFVAETAPILLSQTQVAVKLGVSCSTVRALQRKGALPVVMFGAIRRIPVAAVNEYVKRNAFVSVQPKRAASVVTVPRPAVAQPVAAPVRSRLGFSSHRGV